MDSSLSACCGGFVLASVFALVAIVITGRYPPFRLATGGDEPHGPADPDHEESPGPIEHPTPV